MKIRFQSLHGMQQITMPHALGHDLGVWYNGQERDIPDDLKIRWRVADGGAIVLIPATDALLSCGPEFVDAVKGTNPDFTCAKCGKTTNADGFLDATYTDPKTGAHIRPYENENGDRLCVADWLASNPNHEQLHVERGLHKGVLEEARGIRASASAPTPAPTPAPVFVPPPPISTPAPNPPEA